MSEVKEMASAVGATETGEEVLTMSKEHSYVHNYSNIVLRAGQVVMRVQEVNNIGRTYKIDTLYPMVHFNVYGSFYELITFYGEGQTESIRSRWCDDLDEAKLCEMLDWLDEIEDVRRELYV